MRDVRSALCGAVCTLWLAACGHQAHSPASAESPAVRIEGLAPSPGAPGAQSASAAAKATISNGPSSLASSPASAGVPTKLPNKVPLVAPDAAPKILAVAMSETSVHPGDRVSGRVVTTSNVASVQARIGGYAVSLSKIGVGRFALTYTVAPLPWFVRGNFTMQVIARNTRGDITERAIPLSVR